MLLLVKLILNFYLHDLALESASTEAATDAIIKNKITSLAHISDKIFLTRFF